jgi:hypothetical protein
LFRGIIICKIYEKQRGFYTQQLGYQRKRMNKRFRERFSHEKTFIFTGKGNFDYAYKCVDYYWNDDTKEDVDLRMKISNMIL